MRIALQGSEKSGGEVRRGSNMQQPFFSIIIPTKARPVLVDVALYSLHHQTFSDFEVIITDDYDDEALSCKDIVEKYQDPRFMYVHPPDEPVLGMCGNWEYGLQFAKGQYIGFMQDKMYMYADTLQSLYTCIQAENMPDMVNWGWDFYILNQMDGGALDGSLGRRMDLAAGKWERRDPEAEIKKKLDFPNGDYQEEGGIPGCGSLLAGVVKSEILCKINEEYGSVFNFFNPDYGPPLLVLSVIKTLYFHKENLYIMIPHNSSEGLRHSISYKEACRFQDMSVCGVERLQYATVPYLRITNTNMISADYNYTMRLLGRSERCNEENVLKGVIRQAAMVRYESQEDYQKENKIIRDVGQKRRWKVIELPQDRGGDHKKKKRCPMVASIHGMIPQGMKNVIKTCLRMPRYKTSRYQSPKESIFR